MEVSEHAVRALLRGCSGVDMTGSGGQGDGSDTSCPRVGDEQRNAE